MKIILKIIDTISEYSGRIFCWLAVILMLVFVFETTARYVFDSPTMWGYETSYMVGATMAVMGWSYTHKHHGHIRVDVIYTHLSLRAKAIIDIVCSFLFLFPLLALLIHAANASMLFALKLNERLMESAWRPPAAPIKMVVLAGISLFALQCLAQFARDVYALIRSKPYDTD